MLHLSCFPQIFHNNSCIIPKCLSPVPTKASHTTGQPKELQHWLTLMIGVTAWPGAEAFLVGPPWQGPWQGIPPPSNSTIWTPHHPYAPELLWVWVDWPLMAPRLDSVGQGIIWAPVCRPVFTSPNFWYPHLNLFKNTHQQTLHSVTHFIVLPLWAHPAAPQTGGYP